MALQPSEAPRTINVSIEDLDPSDLIMMMQKNLSEATSRVRTLRFQASPEELEELTDLLDDLEDRIKNLVAFNIAAIDLDPEVRAKVDRLTALTTEVKKAVREMRDAKAAIDQGVKIVENVDAFFMIGLRAAGLLTGKPPL
jgi:chromosome segregation ATPase